MNEKQQQLTFDKGITNVPSDALCSDNTLKESLGMVYDNGEHRVIQKPMMYVEGHRASDQPGLAASSKILYVHRTALGEHFIYLDDGNKLKYFTRSNNGEYVEGTYHRPGGTVDAFAIYESFTSSDVMVTSNGNTLIIRGDKKLLYSLWKPEKGYYDYLGPLPVPKFDFQMVRVNGFTQDYLMSNTGSSEGIIGDYASILNTKAYDDLIKGLYAKNKKDIASTKRFCLPFAIRAALKMYDGSYVNATNPIFMFPSLRSNSYIAKGTSQTTVYTVFQSVVFDSMNSLSDWSDIVESIAIFVTQGLEIYDLTIEGDAYLHDADGIYSDGTRDQGSYYHELQLADPSSIWTSGFAREDSNYLPASMINNSVFYKLCEIGLSPIFNAWLENYIDGSVLENITEQERLPLDYHSLCPLNPNYMYMYNGRLNLASVERGFFEGFDNFLPWDHDNSKTYNYDFYVTIRTESGDYVVKHSVTNSKQRQGAYFYYPDSRAVHVVIKAVNYSDATDVYYIDEDLTEHPQQNGAYFFKGWPSSTYPADIKASATIPSYDNSKLEPLPNYVISSEINNPWVFKAEGYHKVGTGKILAISTVTQALSEGQFGQFPLLVFSDSGIWAMSVGSTGLFTDIHPMSREVCNNPKGITQTDGAIYFPSEKGLMLVDGANVRCVSEQLNGRFGEGDTNFADLLRTAFIAYDYRDSLLWIFDGSQAGSRYCYIYSMKSGTFAKYDFGNFGTWSQIITVKGVINSYPDYFIKVGTPNIDSLYSLLQRPNINKDGQNVTSNGVTTFVFNTYNAIIETRPMKLENALALKSIMQIRHILQFHPYTVQETQVDPDTQQSVTTEVMQKGTMTLRIFASNNLDAWVELHSLRGTPWKYYKFRYDFSNMIATDRFAGTMLITQERRTNKLR